MNGWQLGLTVIGLAAAAVNAGAFFAFSNFVMPALGTIRAAEGMRSMQAINVAAPSRSFVATIVGAGPIAIPVLFGVTSGTAAWLAAAIALSITSFLVTMAANVPRNNALDRRDADTEEGTTYWATYLRSWTVANTVRTLTSLGSVVAYGLALASASMPS